MKIEYAVKCNCGNNLIITDATINHLKGEISFYVHDHECESPFLKLLESGKKIKMTIEKCQCPTGSHEARGRSIDVPVIEGVMTLRAVRLIHCPTCKVNYVRDEYLEELERQFTRAGIPTNKTFLWGMISKGLDYWEQKFGTKYETKEEGGHGGAAGGEEGDDDN
jgi:hypothetical protein